MSKRTNPVAIGSFVIGIIIMAIFMAVFFGGGNLFSNTQRIVLVFSSSVKGLTNGAPVTIQGVKIGEVISIKANMYTSELKYLTTVTLSINPDSIGRVGIGDTEDGNLLEELLARGLGAQLKLQSLLTGLLYIDVDFYGVDKQNFEDIETQYPQFPTVTSELEMLTEQLESLNIKKLIEQFQTIAASLEKTVSNPEFVRMGSDLHNSLESITQLADNLNYEIKGIRSNVTPVTDEATIMLKQLNRDLPTIMVKVDDLLVKLDDGANKLSGTLSSADYLLSDDSPLLYQLSLSASELEKAAISLQGMTNAIDLQPESIFLGKQGH
jgi:paraquat-inducible protein B